MPIYEFECRECGTRFEKLVFNSEERVLCKHCESPKIEPRLSVFAVGGGRADSAAQESGPCGSCGAPERGMCRNS